MKMEKRNIFTLTTIILSIIILLIGATFSYFTMIERSKNNELDVEAAKISIGLGVSPIYTGHKLIPTNDEDIMKAYNQKCVDDLNNGACLAYGLEVFNYYKAFPITGKIDFKVKDIENLSYMILDENDNVYLEKTPIKGETTGMPLGPSFELEDANGIIPTSKKFILLVWLTNLKDEDQAEQDSGGSFTAKITYESIAGGKTVASIGGQRKSKN